MGQITLADLGSPFLIKPEWVGIARDQGFLFDSLDQVLGQGQHGLNKGRIQVAQLEAPLGNTLGQNLPSYLGGIKGLGRQRV